jgi:glycosyltransferase involved in cell wall biosynthesis
MKMYPLAVISPELGKMSETFIYRHMTELLPGKTCIIVRKALPYANELDIPCPCLVFGHYRMNFPWLLRGLQYFFRLSELSPVQVKVQQFLYEHGVNTILSQYLDQSVKWLKVAQNLNIRFFAHAHGYDISQALCNPIMIQRYRQLEKADGIITMSSYSREKLIKFGLSGSNIYVIPYGIEIPEKCNNRREDGQIRCLAVGRMVAKKAPIYTIEAFRQALKRNNLLSLDYVGDGPLFDEVREFVHGNGLNEKIVLHGSQSNQYVLKLFAKADIFLQHSRTDPLTADEEGLPVSILEAMAHGVPVVSTFHAGIPEAIIQNVTGLMVQEGDTDGMAECIMRLAGDPKLRIRLGNAGRLRAREHYSWQKERNSLLELFGFENTTRTFTRSPNSKHSTENMN